MDIKEFTKVAVRVKGISFTMSPYNWIIKQKGKLPDIARSIAESHKGPGLSEVMDAILPTMPSKALGMSVPGSKSALLKKSLRGLSPHQRRGFMAHEAFHAKNKTIGKSELLADIYGAYRAGKKGEGLSGRLRKGLSHLFRTSMKKG